MPTGREIEEKREAVVSLDFNDLLNKPKVKSYFPIYAEEDGDLGNNRFEWGFGDGNNTPDGMGVVIPFECQLFAVGLSLQGNADVTVEVRKNTSSTGKSVSTTNNKLAWISFENDTVQYDPGDVLNFFTISGDSSSNGGIIVAWFFREEQL